jgi:hypothetical protein
MKRLVRCYVCFRPRLCGNAEQRGRGDHAAANFADSLFAVADARVEAVQSAIKLIVSSLGTNSQGKGLTPPPIALHSSSLQTRGCSEPS